MARNKPCRDPRVVRQSDVLMPVSPNEERSSESLSHNGETVAAVDRDTAMGSMARKEAEDDDGGDDTEEDDEVMEARVAKGRKSPLDPTRKEREEHELTHMPFRSWCEDCVQSRARNAHHRTKVAREPL